MINWKVRLASKAFWVAVNDPTTAGLSDSKLAMSYTKPKED